MQPEGIMLSEISQTHIQRQIRMLSIYITIYVWNQKKKKVKLIETESTKAVARAWESGEMEKYDSIGENFLLNYTNKFQTSSVQHCACS